MHGSGRNRGTKEEIGDVNTNSECTTRDHAYAEELHDERNFSLTEALTELVAHGIQRSGVGYLLSRRSRVAQQEIRRRSGRLNTPQQQMPPFSSLSRSPILARAAVRGSGCSKSLTIAMVSFDDIT